MLCVWRRWQCSRWTVVGSVPAAQTRSYVVSLNPSAASEPPPPERCVSGKAYLKLASLIRAYRNSGHMVARIDPLEGVRHSEAAMKQMAPELSAFRVNWPHSMNLSAFGLADEMTEDTLVDVDTELHAFTDGPVPLRRVVEVLEDAYCGTASLEYAHVVTKAQKIWLRDRIETLENPYVLSRQKQLQVLRWLAECEELERYLKRQFPAAKRFSLEGCESIIPSLFTVIGRSVQNGVDSVQLGMAHRGRINVLANIMNKPLASIFEEFRTTSSQPHVGDVKYHLGTQTTVKFPRGQDMVDVNMAIAANPSHLEAVLPVVMGRTRAEVESLDADTLRVLGVCVHGDASFSGQGIVAETLQLSALEDYRVSGMIHVVLNNQIGFTTSAVRGRSSVHPTDIAKTIGCPIFHVNADDPEAVCAVSRLAADYRARWRSSVVIDLVGYRRHGHNEQDNPRYTQPIMYSKIKALPSVVASYSDKLIAAGLLTPEELQTTKDELYARFHQEFTEKDRAADEHAAHWFANTWQADVLRATAAEAEHTLMDVDTGVDRATLVDLGTKATTVASTLADCYMNVVEHDTDAASRRYIHPGRRSDLLPPAVFNKLRPFQLHPDVEKIMAKRRRMVETGTRVDWAMAEALAIASLTNEGATVRMSGQDTERGTFNHRHAVLFDQATEASYVPLTRLGVPGRLQIMNSNLSEAAVMAYEYGYSLHAFNALTIWEAQFGDFANTAQSIIDTFIATGSHRWFQQSNLVLLLPHGMDGQGPDHSSARLERFLQLCADSMAHMPGTSAAELAAIDQGFDAADVDGTGEVTLAELNDAISSFQEQGHVSDVTGGLTANAKAALAAMDTDGSGTVDRREWRMHMSRMLRRAAALSANLTVANPTTPAQYFHLLRRQVHRQVHLPLVVMSSKSLLHHTNSFSTLDDMATGTSFQTVIDDPVVGDPADVTRLILCSGKVYYALWRSPQRDTATTAVVRVEELSPFPYDALRGVMNRYPNATTRLWAQEEPENMGAWSYVMPRLATLEAEFFTGEWRSSFAYAGPPPVPCTTGSFALHKATMAQVVTAALVGDVDPKGAVVQKPAGRR